MLIYLPLALTGLSRYDNLLTPHQVKRQILVMPTQREWLRVVSSDTLYIRETGAGWFAENKNDLKQVIIAILTDADNRDEVLTKAKRIAIENHNVNTNCDIFKQTLLSIL